jgi:hypothetical protein
LWKFDLPLFGFSKARVAAKNKTYRSGKSEKYSLSIESQSRPASEPRENLQINLNKQINLSTSRQSSVGQDEKNLSNPQINREEMSGSEWLKMPNTVVNSTYYYNSQTGEASWVRPEDR